MNFFLLVPLLCELIFEFIVNRFLFILCLFIINMSWYSILIKFCILFVFKEHLFRIHFHLKIKKLNTFAIFYYYFFLFYSYFLRLSYSFFYLSFKSTYLLSCFHTEGYPICLSSSLIYRSTI